MANQDNNYQGSCACGFVNYEVESKPFIVHCCHCTYCQKQTGSAFVINALFDSKMVMLLSGEVENVMTPSPSQKGQNIVRCQKCKVAIWSNYYMGGIKDKISFVRVGTLDNPDKLPPDVHIYTTTKQDWVRLPKGALIFESFYKFEETWTEANNKILQSMLESI